MPVFYHSRNRKESAPAWAEYIADLDEFLGRVDVVSIHIALNQQTVGFVGEKQLRAMKKGSILINTARGKVVDEEALIKVLEDGHVSMILTRFRDSGFDSFIFSSSFCCSHLTSYSLLD